MRVELFLKHGPTQKPAIVTINDFGSRVIFAVETPGPARTELTLSPADAADLIAALQLLAGVVEREYPRAKL